MKRLFPAAFSVIALLLSGCSFSVTAKLYPMNEP